MEGNGPLLVSASGRQPPKIRILEVVVAGQDELAVYSAGCDIPCQERRGELDSASVRKMYHHQFCHAAIVIKVLFGRDVQTELEIFQD